MLTIIIIIYIGDPEEELRYSASIESIRAQSLALGDLCMSDKDKGIKETRDQVEEEGEEREENKISKQQKIPTITTTAPIKDQVRQNSNLSLLLQKQANEQSETQPLLSSSQTRTTNSTIPTYQSTTTTDNKYDDHEHLPTGNNLHKRRSSIQSLPSIQPITKTLSKNQQQLQQQQQQQLQQQQQHRNLRYSFRSLSWKSIIIRPLECIPSVILGLLLNLLDAISYGNNNKINKNKKMRYI